MAQGEKTYYDLWYQDGVDGRWYVHQTDFSEQTLEKVAENYGWSSYQICHLNEREQIRSFLNEG